MRATTIELYQKAMRLRGWYFTRLYPWRVRIKRYPFLTVWYALADRFWSLVVALKGSPFLTMRTFWGQKLKAPFPDYRSLLHHGILDARELPVEEYLVSHLTERDVFFDVGANIGFYTALAQALEVPAYAFEPTARTFAILSRNAPGAVLVNKALSDTEGEVSFIDLGPGEAGSNAIVPDGEGNAVVQATTLDAYCSQHGVYPTCIKMDVEHAELQALTGARSTLSACRPVLIIETGDARVIDLLTSLGYAPYHFDHAASGAILRYHDGEEILSANMLFLPEQRVHPPVL